MRKYICAAVVGISLTAIGVGGYLLSMQNQQLGAKVSTLERKVEELVIPSEQNKEKMNLYQRIQKLDNKFGEWIKKH